MQIIFSSKNLSLTDGFKEFVERKLVKLSKFTSEIRVNVDVDSKRKKTVADAQVELVASSRHKVLVAKDQDETFYKAFFKSLSKMKRLLTKEHERTL